MRRFSTVPIYPDIEIYEEHIHPEDIRQKSRKGIYKVQIRTRLRVKRMGTWFFISFYKKTEIYLDIDYMNALLMFTKSFHAEVYRYQFLAVVSSGVVEPDHGECLFIHDSDTRTEEERLRNDIPG